MVKIKDKNQNLDGLNQKFLTKSGKYITLKSFLNEGDWWELKSHKRIVYIMLHDAIKRIADEAGISSAPDYTVLTQPTEHNNMTYLMQVKICDDKGRCTVDLGETNRSNLGARGRSNPANMAQKRAFDRAVLRHLKIQGFLGEDELPDKEEEKDMDKLSIEEQKQVVPLINEILSFKTKQELLTFSEKMKVEKTKYNELQSDYLRKLWKKKLAELEESF